jgi:hypothetical protein
MMLPQRVNFFSPPQFNAASGAVAGTTQKWAIDRTWPIEEFIVVVNATTHSSGLTSPTLDNILSLVKNVELTTNDGVQPRSVVNYSGPGLLEYAAQAGLCLDRATMAAVALAHSGATIPASSSLRLAYRVPLVHPSVTEPLRTRMLLDIQNHPQDPVLTITYGATADMGTNAFSAITTDIVLVRREMTTALNKSILSNGGFIPFDLLEVPWSIATGVSGEQRFAISTPGSYLNLLFRQYKGGSSVTRDVLDAVTTLGSESRWRLESGGVVIRDWKWKHLQTINDYSRPSGGIYNVPTVGTGFIAASSGGGVTTAITDATAGVVPGHWNNPNFGGKPASNTYWAPAGSAMLDFLTDGLVDTAMDLSSTLNCNLPAATGLKMEVIGPVASVATNASTLYIGGHRLFGDVSKWQALK